MIAARRPNSPLLAAKPARGTVAASATPAASPRAAQAEALGPDAADATLPATPATVVRGNERPQRRSARIVQLRSTETDERETQRRRLLDRLMSSEGRGAISRAASDYREAGFEFPEEQEVQLQLLEHFNEELACAAVDVLARLLADATPIKRPVLEQRLRRLEEYADDPATREAAATLRRTIRA